MLHARLQDHRTLGSEDDFLNILAICGYGGNLGHVT